MITYYDSDEEVAWGELTRAEILNQLLKSDRRIERRNSDLGEYRIESTENQTNGSGLSGYYTPDETLQPRPSCSKKTKPKIRVVRDNQGNHSDSETSFQTAGDIDNMIKNSNDTLSKILKMGERSNDNLDNIEQSLVDNTDTVISLSSDSDEEGEQAACALIKKQGNCRSSVSSAHHPNYRSQSFEVIVDNESQNSTPSRGRIFKKRFHYSSSESLEIIIISDDELENVADNIDIHKEAPDSTLYKREVRSFSNSENIYSNHENDPTMSVQQTFDELLRLTRVEELPRRHSLPCCLEGPRRISSRGRGRPCVSCGETPIKSNLPLSNTDNSETGTLSGASESQSDFPYSKNRPESETIESSSKTSDTEKSVESPRKKQFDTEKSQLCQLSRANLDRNDSLQDIPIKAHRKSNQSHGQRFKSCLENSSKNRKSEINESSSESSDQDQRKKVPGKDKSRKSFKISNQDGNLPKRVATNEKAGAPATSAIGLSELSDPNRHFVNNNKSKTHETIDKRSTELVSAQNSAKNHLDTKRAVSDEKAKGRVKSCAGRTSEHAGSQSFEKNIVQPERVSLSSQNKTSPGILGLNDSPNFQNHLKRHSGGGNFRISNQDNRLRIANLPRRVSSNEKAKTPIKSQVDRPYFENSPKERSSSGKSRISNQENALQIKKSPKRVLSGNKRKSHGETSRHSRTSTGHDDTLNFNDTMEEMEMALKQGLDYVMPGDETKTSASKSSHIPVKVTPAKQTSIQKKPVGKFDYIESPVGEYIKGKSPTKLFKSPPEIKKQKITKSTSAPTVPKKTSNNAVSCVGVYVKNSPATFLKQNIRGTPTNALKPKNKSVTSTITSSSPSTGISASTPGKTNKENIDSPFPKVIYKPARKIELTESKEPTLPPSIRKMIKEPVVMKHEKRIQKVDSNESSVSRILLEEDLTILNQSNEDVSFVTKKQAFKK